MAEDRFARPTLGEFVCGLVDGAPEQGGDLAVVESLAFDLPVEIGSSSDGESVVALTMSPPTQIVETTVMPVFHRLRATVARMETW